ncbi:unnamed protein product, partial [Rotaria magnacalcarata]
DHGRKRNSIVIFQYSISFYIFLARYDARNKDIEPPPHHYYQRRSLSPVSFGDVCNRISKVSFDNCPHKASTRIRNRSAEPHQSDKPHDNRPPSVSAIRSVVPDRLKQDQLP